MLSRCLTVDEECVKHKPKIENLSLEDFYEALCRVAMLKALPTDDEVAEAGFADAGEFLLELQEEPNDHAEYLEEWELSHPDPTNAVHIKATQPAARCLSHLMALIIRTVHRLAEAAEDEELKVTKKHMKRVTQRI